MTRRFTYQCRKCKTERVFSRRGERLAHACQECADVTTWERGERVGNSTTPESKEA